LAIRPTMTADMAADPTTTIVITTIIMVANIIGTKAPNTI
jgi:hypothetical protein